MGEAAGPPYSDQKNFMARQSEASFGQDQFVVGKCRVLRVFQGEQLSGLLLTCGAQMCQEASMDTMPPVSCDWGEG